MPKKSPTGRGRGRPEHQPTPALRRKVSIAAGGGMLHEEIALALGISRETLRKYYQQELSVEAQKRRLEVLEAVFKTAKAKGTSSAAKTYLANVPELEAPPREGEVAAPAAPAPTPAPAEKLGKKEQAQADSRTAAAGTDWESLLPRPGAPLQ